MKKTKCILVIIINLAVIVASMLTTFYCLPSTREFLLAPQPTEEEWKQMEYFAYQVAQGSTYYTGILELPEYGEETEEIEVVELKASSNVLSAEVRKGHSYVTASFRPWKAFYGEGKKTTMYDYSEVFFLRYQKNTKESIIIDCSSNWERIWLWVRNIVIAVIVGTMIGITLLVLLCWTIIVIADFSKKSSTFLKKIFDYFLEKGKRLNRKFISWLKNRGEV